MSKSIGTFLIFLFVQNVVNSQTAGRDTIEFFVEGAYDKPYYSFVFFPDNGESVGINDRMFFRKIKAEPQKFDSIAAFIEKCEFSGSQHLLNGRYCFVIIRNGDKQIFYSDYVEPLKKVFRFVYLCLINNPEAESLKLGFNQALLRLARIGPII